MRSQDFCFAINSLLSIDTDSLVRGWLLLCLKLGSQKMLD